ncbi:MAG: peptide-methionine (R)-S-oxide reductase MsrB [Verrucomicrobiota bacterium]|nr:peptide-methionine (R)-S-oxide reductase MsrB [Verrucomicrobiota bacterium]
MKNILTLYIAGVSVALILLGRAQSNKPASTEKLAAVVATEADLAPLSKIEKSNDEWKASLSPAQFAVMRKKATERPGSSPLLHEHRAGIFRCAACDAPLFASDAKFESGTGWPSFFKTFVDKNVATTKDKSLFMERDEVLCARCGAHLGHVFDDGPQPTGLRYCMNGVALKFEPRP